MKMKLVQRVVIGYYKTKLRTIAIVSPRKAAEQALRVFCTPYSKGVKQKEPIIFRNTIKHSLSFETLNTKGFQWKPEQPNGQRVLIIHGFSSYSYKFEKYISPLLRAGFEVLAFDAPAHGLSEGKTINAIIYMRFLQAVEQQFGPINGFIAHSLGGLATSLLIEQLDQTITRKLVLIAPATETRSAVNEFYSIFGIKEPIKTEFEQLIFDITGQQIDHFSIRRVMQTIQIPVLWIHDEADRICPYSDTLPIQAMHLPHIRFRITNGLGHNKIYRDKQVMTDVFDFLLYN